MRNELTQAQAWIRRHVALRSRAEAIAWLLAVAALIGAVITEGKGSTLLHAGLFVCAFILLFAIVLGRRVRRGEKER